MTSVDRIPQAPRTARRWMRAAAAVATLAAAGAAHAGDVRWSIGLNLPLPPLPGVVVRSAPAYSPPVVYAPPRAYADVYGPSYRPDYGPEYGPAYGPDYGPEVVTYDSHPRHARYRYIAPAPVYVQPRVIVRPSHGHWDRGHGRHDHGRHWDRGDRGHRDGRGWDRGRH